MSNFTIEDYKEAIRAKYEKDINNPLSDSLTSLGQAYLRDFCWQKFEGELSEDDKRVFNSFFGCEFNAITRNLFRDSTDRFKPIGTFLKRQTDLSIREAVDLTAIMVDFQHRPFRKFREKGVITYLKHPKDSIIFETFAVQGDEENIENKEVTSGKATSGQFEVMPAVSKPQPISLFVIAKEKILQRLTKKLSRTAAVIAIVFFLGFVISYYAFPKKQCMQWNNDHYDLVDCDLKIEGLGMTNKIELLDPGLIDLKKINVCDTTTCFDKNGTAIIWYAKNGEGVDFFNTHGRHPENDKPLRPVTEYILKKYKK